MRVAGRRVSRAGFGGARALVRVGAPAARPSQQQGAQRSRTIECRGMFAEIGLEVIEGGPPIDQDRDDEDEESGNKGPPPGMWPHPDFIAQVQADFPDKGIATVEEARTLIAPQCGYTYVDVRPTLECEEVGKYNKAVNIPIAISTKKYDPEQKKKVVHKSDNPDFVRMVEKKFPNKEAKLLIGCSDGRAYSIDALEALDEAGYVNIVGLKGGFYAFYNSWDQNLRRRIRGEYAERYDSNARGADSCGIHASGAGFDRVDAIEQWVPPTY